MAADRTYPVRKAFPATPQKHTYTNECVEIHNAIPLAGMASSYVNTKSIVDTQGRGPIMQIALQQCREESRRARTVSPTATAKKPTHGGHTSATRFDTRRGNLNGCLTTMGTERWMGDPAQNRMEKLKGTRADPASVQGCAGQPSIFNRLAIPSFRGDGLICTEANTFGEPSEPWQTDGLKGESPRPQTSEPHRPNPITNAIAAWVPEQEQPPALPVASSPREARGRRTPRFDLTKRKALAHCGGNETPSEYWPMYKEDRPTKFDMDLMDFEKASTAASSSSRSKSQSRSSPMEDYREAVSKSKSKERPRRATEEAKAAVQLLRGGQSR
eukprot:TRINITY_DN31065_c0_g1_i2.p1 TRINITY_DN31065_c0_g1~~TRINITY_DN31065_c0_g1_i2.p1  ORF type:complete len:329 (+),score=50.30 TRINITY_DN31065_c0_g1_i2:69-1055(+)